MSNSQQSRLLQAWCNLPPEDQRLAWVTIWPLLCESKVMPPPIPLRELVENGILTSDEQSLIASVWRENGIAAE